MKNRTESFEGKLHEAEGIADIFEVVKEVVREVIGKERSGLMLGLADLGISNEGYIGAFYPVDSNVIVMNKAPLRRVERYRPELLKPYVFHLLLHEYIHALGIIDEGYTRQLAYAISEEIFGEGHIVTRLARNITAVLPEIMYPGADFSQPDMNIELVEGFDMSSWGYIG